MEEGSAGRVVVDAFGGRIHVEWDDSAPVTPLGQIGSIVALVIKLATAKLRGLGQVRPYAEFALPVSL